MSLAWKRKKMLKLSNKINYKKINQYRIYINKKIILKKKGFLWNAYIVFVELFVPKWRKLYSYTQILGSLIFVLQTKC